jgi:quercetin dioxygenase-like cupin family protein
LIFALYEFPQGVTTDDGSSVTYDLERGEAHFGRADIAGPAIVWRIDGSSLVTQCHKGVEAAVAVELELDPSLGWIARCDRVEFPPAAVAHQHVHPGPGIRRIVDGELTIDGSDGTHTYASGGSWFENADDPVMATASAAEGASFVRVLLLPPEWAGKRTIRYLDPADDLKPKLQRATILLEEPLDL